MKLEYTSYDEDILRMNTMIDEAHREKLMKEGPRVWLMESNGEFPNWFRSTFPYYDFYEDIDC